ncbi:hypothetical protein AAVH_26818 [Aphelenchoides avenae]|nr:hypothetical protein AAVH_26818 [Aphelenchus avenae]
MRGRYDSRSSKHYGERRDYCGPNTDRCPNHVGSLDNVCFIEYCRADPRFFQYRPAPCDCVHVIRGVCQAIDDSEKCIAACQGLGLGVGACVDLYGVSAEAALCVCIGPFQPGAGGGNGCEAGPSTSVASSTPVASSSTPGPCDCINVIRGVCTPVAGAQQCIAACQGQGLGAGVCVDILDIDLEAGLCVCIGPFGPGSGGGNGCEAGPSTSVASSSTPGPCDCINVIRGVCQPFVGSQQCIAACGGLGLGAGVCVDISGIDLEAGLCVCVGPFSPGSGGGNGCEAGTTPALPSTTPSVTSSTATSTPSDVTTSLASTTPAPCDCVNVIDDVCQAVSDTEKCIAACEGAGLGVGACLDLPDIAGLEAAICVCTGPFQPGAGGNGCEAATTPALPTTTQSAATTASESVSSSSVATTSVATSSTPAPCDCVNVIRGVCRAVDDTEECIAACQGLGLGAGVCVDLLGVGVEAALCVCTGPFSPGSGGGNGCEAALTTTIASSTPAPCDCINVIRGVCQPVVGAEQCIAACQGLGLGAGVCVDILGVGLEAGLCVCVGPFRPGSGGGNGCEAATTPSIPSTTPSAATTASESTSSTSVLSTSIASSTPAPCDCVNVIPGVCRAVVDTENCITACQGLGLGAGVCVDLLGVGVEAALCVCTGPFRPGSGGGNGCEAGTTPSLPSTTPSTAPSEPTTASVSQSTSAVSTTAPGQCIRSIDDICKDPLSIVDKAICDQQCKLPPYNLRAGVCVSLPPYLGAGLCVCL